MPGGHRAARADEDTRGGWGDTSGGSDPALDVTSWDCAEPQSPQHLASSWELATKLTCSKPAHTQTNPRRSYWSLQANFSICCQLKTEEFNSGRRSPLLHQYIIITSAPQVLDMRCPFVSQKTSSFHRVMGRLGTRTKGVLQKSV